jgi:hypothetical protein
MSTGMQFDKLPVFYMHVSLFEFPLYNGWHSGEFISTHLMLKIPEEPDYKLFTCKLE